MFHAFVKAECSTDGLRFVQKTLGPATKRLAVMAKRTMHKFSHKPFSVPLSSSYRVRSIFQKTKALGTPSKPENEISLSIFSIPSTTTWGEERNWRKSRQLSREKLSDTRSRPKTVKIKLPHRQPRNPIRKDIMSFLSQFSRFCNGSMGKITTVNHHIDLEPDPRPAVQHPYRAELKTKDHGGQGINQLLKEGVIRPAESEWTSLVAFAAKNDGKLRFCVYYRTLSAMTVRDTYSFPWVDRGVDSLKDTVFSFTTCCNSRYWQIEISGADYDRTTFIQPS